MTSKNILLVGRGTIAVNCLKILKRNKVLPKIIICDNRDDGIDTWNKSLYKYAITLDYKEGLNLFKQTNVNDQAFISRIKERCPFMDIVFSIQPKALFKKDFINLASENVFNMHFAPLPKLRGVQTSSWAIIDGLKSMGVTIHLITKHGIDNDPIVSQKLFPVLDNDTAWSLYNKCVKCGTKLFNASLTKLVENKFKAKPQNNKRATYHALNELDYSDLEVPVKRTIKMTSNFIRARLFPPLQRPFFYFGSKKVYVGSVVGKISEHSSELTTKRKNLYYYACLDGKLIIRGARR